MWLTAGAALAGRIDRTEYALMRAAAERARDEGTDKRPSSGPWG